MCFVCSCVVLCPERVRALSALVLVVERRDLTFWFVCLVERGGWR